MTRMPWLVERVLGSAEELHSWEPPDSQRVARWTEVDRPALVLGSAQRPSLVDTVAAADLGIDVVGRRSGGGAVLTLPGEILWLDVVVPAGDPLWDDDVARSMWWFGECWAEALEAVGVGAVEVHRGPLERSRWSGVVCFDGLGPGEVLVEGRKAVGISQRRTRRWARLQAAIHLRWRPDLLATLLSPTGVGASDLRAPFCLDSERARQVRDGLDRLLVAR